MTPLFKIIFEDGTHRISGPINEPKWSAVQDNKPIKAIQFVLQPNGDYLVLHDYEAYNVLIEVARDVYGVKKSGPRIEHVYFLGLRGDKVTSYRVTLTSDRKDKYQLGDITRRVFPRGKEYNGGPTQGWKSARAVEEVR
jgi:hypothetical protein